MRGGRKRFGAGWVSSSKAPTRSSSVRVSARRWRSDPCIWNCPRTRSSRRVTETLGLLGLDDLAERAPYNLSGGEKKKVALASVLSMNPEVLMLDEPTNGLDPRTQHWLIELLGRLHMAGKTLIVATHRLETLYELADRAVVLSEDHRVVAVGPVDSILADRDLLLEVNLIHPHGASHFHRT